MRRLSVFVGGCTLEAVEAVYHALGNEPGQVVEAVASLIDKSLLQPREQVGGVSRFTMLETIREYGLETLATSEEEEAVRQAHAKYHLQLATEGYSHLYGADEQDWGWYARLEQDHENLQAALHWLLERKEAELALRLCNVLWWFWLVQGHVSEGCAFLEQTLAASEEVAKAERAEALNGLGLLLVNKGDNEQAERRLEESLALYRELGDTVNTGWPLHQSGARNDGSRRVHQSTPAVRGEPRAFQRDRSQGWPCVFSLPPGSGIQRAGRIQESPRIGGGEPGPLQGARRHGRYL